MTTIMENKDQSQSSNQRDSLSESIWHGSTGRPDQSETGKFNSGEVYDCLIVGAGITGITTALLLQKAGMQCVIAEAKSPGFGTTGGTSAHLNTFFDATYPEIESDFGADAAKLVARGGKESFDMIWNFAKEFGIDCDLEYKQAWLYAENEEESKQLQQILEASERAGIQVKPADKNGLPIPFESALQFEQQGQFHPLKYIQGLLSAFIALGGILLENTRIQQTHFKDDLHTAESDSVTIRAKNLIYATHIPPGINLLSLRNAPYRSYVTGLKLKDGNYPEGLVYDMQEPYHYFRTHTLEGEKYLIVGGEDHKTGHGDPVEAFERLRNYVNQYYEVESVAYQWSAQYYVPVDGLPYIGQLPGGDSRTYVATGFNGNGMMLGTLSGKIISDLIVGNKNEYADLFNPSRLKPIAGFSEFVKENADVAWHFIADRFSSEELSTLRELKTGEGILARFDGKQLAIYKDDSGKITALKPTCTHAGCTVLFNQAERSWDCPCHGGRYDVSGKVLNGPPLKDLEKVDIGYE
jgi:glycine/D-amino acid oxidase-like deaminating enzyme/nitrite reductase/ring-hydroxylating ferredoxin subunit